MGSSDANLMDSDFRGIVLAAMDQTACACATRHAEEWKVARRELFRLRNERREA